MSNYYFSERELGQPPRTENEIRINVWGGLVALINGLIDKNYFGDKFPERCPDNDGVVGTDELTMSLVISAEFPDIKFPLEASEKPSTLTILDLLEFCHEHIAKPTQGDFHSYWGRHHLDFDIDAGQVEFRKKINHIFSRNRIAFELQENGQISRLVPPVMSDCLQSTVFQTDDHFLDST